MTGELEVGDQVVPRYPVRGTVVKRDVRGGKAGSLVRWPGMSTPQWHPDGDLLVVPDGHIVRAATSRERAG